MIKTYPFDDKTQLSVHFNVSEFRCKCGKAHDTLLADELVRQVGTAIFRPQLLENHRDQWLPLLNARP